MNIFNKIYLRIEQIYRPYKRNSLALFNLCSKSNQNFDINKALNRAKISSSPFFQSNVDFWKFLLSKYEFPKIEAEDIKDEKNQKYLSSILLGISHYEYEIEKMSSDMDMTYAVVVDYAINFICPRRLVLEMIEEGYSVSEISNKFNVPEFCVQYQCT